MSFQKVFWVNLYIFYVVISSCSSDVGKEKNISEQSNINNTEDPLKDATSAALTTEEDLNDSESDKIASIKSDPVMAESRNVKQYSVVLPPPVHYNNYRYLAPYYNRQFRASRSYDEHNYDFDEDDDVDEVLNSNEQMVGMAHSSYLPGYETEQNYAVPQQTCGGHVVIGCQPVVRTVPCSSYHQSYETPTYSAPAPVYNLPTPAYHVSSPHQPASTQTSYRENEENKTESAKDTSTAKN